MDEEQLTPEEIFQRAVEALGGELPHTRTEWMTLCSYIMCSIPEVRRIPRLMEYLRQQFDIPLSMDDLIEVFTMNVKMGYISMRKLLSDEFLIIRRGSVIIPEIGELPSDWLDDYEKESMLLDFEVIKQYTHHRRDYAVLSSEEEI